MPALGLEKLVDTRTPACHSQELGLHTVGCRGLEHRNYQGTLSEL